jgi:hypothetical protein
MTKLDMSKQNFAGVPAGKVIGDMLTGNSTLKDLDLSGCRIDSGAAKGTSKGLARNGALSVLSLKNNTLGTKEAGKVLGEMLKENSVLKELDLSDNMYYKGVWKTDPEFAEELAAGIKDNGALSKLDVRNNNISATEKPLLQGACDAKAISLAA